MLRCAHFMGWEHRLCILIPKMWLNAGLMRRGWYMYTRFANKQLIEDLLA